MAFETKKIEISAVEAASAVASGNKDAFLSPVLDSDEFFILRLSYGECEYFFRVSGIYDDGEEALPELNVRADTLKKTGEWRAFADAFSVICANTFLHDRRERSVKINLTLTLDGEEKSISNIYSVSLAERNFDRIMRKLHRRLFAEEDYLRQAAPTLREIKFPYKTIREGQEKFTRRAYSAIKSSKTLFVEAPTGIGKTMAALFAAVRAAGDGHAEKIFYLTAKGSVSLEAYKACEKLFSVGARLRVIRLEAKGKMCPLHTADNFECESYKCPLMKGYADRAEDAIYDLINRKYGITPEDVTECARTYNICPYELSLDLSELCLVVICDYNYAFDPRVHIKRYFDDFSKKRKYVFLIDEAHNLVSRAKEMYSSSISMSDIKNLHTELSECEREFGKNEELEKLKSAVNRFASALNKASSLCEESALADKDGIKHGFYLSNTPYSRLKNSAVKFEKSLSDFKKQNKHSPAYEAVSDFLSDFSSFKEGMLNVTDGMRYYIALDGKEIKAKCMCVDPSMQIGDRLRYAFSTIYFSATLSPPEYYTKMLSGEKNPGVLVLDSPYDRKKLFCAAYTNTSTRFEDRERNAGRIMSVISAVLSAKKGNYMLYFPSYGYMKNVYERFTQKYPTVHTIIQRSNMSSADKKTFMDFFADDTGKLRVGFSVLGGSFSEGIDLPGNRLIGTVIIGVGLPGISSEQNIVKEYYDFEGLDGFDFAYTFPGMNNVLQAAGRVIRSEEDRGVVVFVDDRYGSEKYRRLMPERFSHAEFYEDAHDLSEDIRDFWSKN